MEYILIILLILFVLIVFLIMYLKNNAKNNSSSLPNTKINTKIKETDENETYNNPNPSFKVELIDYKKVQINIIKTSIGEELYFKIAKNKRIKVYTLNNLYIGEIAIKDYNKNIPLLAIHTNYFEGKIDSYLKDKIITKKVIISIKAKTKYSKEIYMIDKNNLNNIINLKSIFEINQIVDTNYGPSTIIKVLNDHLLVEVPSLGTREIYDIETLINN